MKLYKDFINEKIDDNLINYEKLKLLVEKIEELLNKLGRIQNLSRWSVNIYIKKLYDDNDDIYDIRISYSFYNHRSQPKTLYSIKIIARINDYIISNFPRINEYAFYGSSMKTNYIFELLKFVDNKINSIFNKYSDKYKYSEKDINDIISGIDKVIIDLEIKHNANKYNL